jgi:hypothetical protein
VLPPLQLQPRIFSHHISSIAAVALNPRTVTTPEDPHDRLHLIGPHSRSLFRTALDGPPHEYLMPSHLQFIDWPAAQTWRKALIEATGITARVPSP